MHIGKDCERENQATPAQCSCLDSLTEYLKTCFSCVLKHPALCLPLLGALCVVTVDMLVYKAGQKLPAVEVPFWNNVILSCLSVLVLLVFRPGPPSTMSEVLNVIIAGSLCGFGASLLLLAIIFDSPGDAIALYFTMPTFAIFLGYLLYNEKPRVSHMILSFLAVSGVLLVSGPTFLFVPSSLTKSQTFYGIAMSLTSAILTSAGFVLVRRLSEIYHTNPFFITLTASAAGCMVSFALCVYFRSFTIPTTTVTAMTLFGNGFFSFGAYVTTFLALRYEKASYVTIAMTSEVLLSFLAQFLLFKIVPTHYSLSGAVMITVACVGLAFVDDEQHEEEEEERAELLDKD